jgi:DNA-binding MarR family transcriptional regulator
MIIGVSSTPTPERPTITAVLGELRTLSTAIDQLDQASAERFGLNRTDHRCLDMLGATGRMTAKELAAALGLTTGGVTTVIDRLERSGYARRRPHPNDRRQVLVEATPLTADRADQVFGPLITATRDLAAGYSDPELTVVTDFLRKWRASVTAHTALIATAAAGHPVDTI